ncbi:MAG: tail fiber protein [Alphaproteobacteria bacterium]|nr:tail fiber protein [Alphaproteobacteria bacterium]
MDPFVGEIRLFAFTTVVPRGWYPCDGRTLPINTNQALYSLLGTRYGGNGTTNFMLPDLRGRVPVSAVTYTLTAPWDPGPQGASAGAETVTLTTTTVPPHTHSLYADSGTAHAQRSPADNFLASGSTANQLIYGAPANLVGLAGTTIGIQGSSAPHANLQPYLVMQYCMAYQGVYPPRQ